MSLLDVLRRDYGDFQVLECKISKQAQQIDPEPDSQLQQIIEEAQQELLNPLQQEDAIVDILIKDKNYLDLNKILMDDQNPSSFAQLVRILINALNILKKLDDIYSAKQEDEFIQLMTIFFEVLNDKLYSVRLTVNQSTVIYQVDIDQKILLLIIQFLTSSLSKLRSKDMLYRLLVFLISDSDIYKIIPNPQENFEFVAQIIVQQLDRNYNNQAIQIIGYLYLAQQKQAEKSNTFKYLIRRIFAYLKSYLTVNQTEFSLCLAIQISKVLNLVFTGRISVILYDIGLFQTIYHALRQLCIVFHPKPSWSSDRQFIQLLISLFKVQLGYLTSIDKKPSDFFNDFSYLCDLITDDCLFLAQKQCACYFVSDVLPSLFVMRAEIIQALCIHDHSQITPVVIKQWQQDQAQIQLLNSDILTVKESETVEEFIRVSINKKQKSQVKQQQFKCLMRYDMESPGFTYDQFVKSIDQKILNTMLVLEVASEKGNLKIVIITSDQFLIQTYKPQNNHSEGEQIINEGGKILSCRSNDDGQIFVFDQQSKKNIYSSLTRIDGGQKHHPNTKKLLEIVPSGLNVYIDDQKFISLNFQDGNMNQIQLELLDQRFGSDPLLLQGEFFILQEAKDQNRIQSTKSIGYLGKIIPLASDFHRQHLEDIFNEFTQFIYLQRVIISPIQLDDLQGVVELNKIGAINIITHVSLKSKDINNLDSQVLFEQQKYPISIQLAYRQMIQELVQLLSLACNAASRPNVQIFLLDLHQLSQQPGWDVNALIQLDGKFVFHLIQMAVLQIDEGSENIFHSAMQAAYTALAQQDLFDEGSLHTLWQQLLNRTQQYYNVELVLKLTKAQQDKKAKQLLEESKKQQKNQKKEIKPIQTSSKPKGIGYGDIGNKQLNQKNIQQSQSSKTKIDLSAFENELVYGSMAEQYRNQIIQKLFKSISSSLKYFTKAPTIALHLEIAYSKLPSIIYSLLKSNSISEILNNEKLPIFDILLNIIDTFGSCMEYGDIIVDRDYGGQDSESSIYWLLKKLNDESEFCGQNFTQENADDDDSKKKFQIQKSEFLKKLHKTTNNLEKQLQASQFLIITHQESNIEGAQNDNNINMSQFYNSLMKSMILGQCSILEQTGYQAQMGSYANNIAVQSKSKLDRIIMELGTMPSSLPCESTNSIFLRYDKIRMDVMRTVIFGSSGTPYAHGAFLYNLHFGDDYPQRPPKCLLETTGHGKVRFNPNLYNCGKVCLSLLGTWGDNWIPNVSTLLQILISIQSMVMSEYVYFNEPGWEHSMGTPEGDKRNRGYCNIVKLANIRYAMIEQIREPPVGFEDVIKKSFYLRRDLILKEVHSWIDEADLDTDYSGSQNHTISQPFQQDSSKYKVVLKAEISELEKEFEKLKLKIQGTLNFGSNTTKKIITHNYSKKSQLYIQEERLHAINEKKNQVKQLFNKPLDDVDVTWEKTHAVRKEFNVESSEVQSLMSRYIGVMGIDSVMKQSQASILIYGLSAVGVEVAKNLVLSGIRRVTLMDKQKDQYYQDGQYYMNDTQNRLQQNYHKISHLNPFVQVDYQIIDKNNNIINVQQYNVIIVCEYDDYDELFNIARQCRKAHTALIIGEARSVYGRIILDLGEQFTVHDRDGEVPIEIHIDQITDEGVVILPKGQKHTFQDGDTIMLREVVSEHDEQLLDMNGKCFKVKSINRSLFSIGNISDYRKFVRNGIAVQVKQRTQLYFRNIEEQVSVLNVKWDETMSTIFTEEELIKRDIVNVLFEHYNRWVFTNKNIPSTLETRIELFEKIATTELLQQLQEKYQQFKYQIYLEQALQFCLTCNGMIHAQAAFIAGIVAQETLKAITHKYIPINQAYVHDCSELCHYQQNDLIKFIDTPNKSIHKDLLNQHILNNLSRDNRYALQQEVLGINTIQKLQNSKLFMVGSGAIGCELLKNFAMLGIGSQGDGRIIITDPDMIEHSNLSRQFLFREKHIRKPKSYTAANSIISMNPDMNGHVVALLDKVCPATNNIFNDYFYQQMNLVANALDNVEARLYIDSKCVQNSIPLIESGTLGPKGHVQVILPNLTESYGSKRDPEESNEIPYCTLKMFPEDSLHCLEWARDKFENMFTNKPQIVHKVLTNLTNSSTLQVIQLETTLRILKKKPKNFLDCLIYARNKYQKFFYNGIMQLLKAYPLDHTDEKGKLFWSSPKRPPFPNNFDSQDKMKLKFVISASILWAEVNMIPIEQELLIDEGKLIQILDKVEVDDFFVDESKLQLIQQQVEKNGQEQQQQQQQGLEQATPNELLLEILSYLGEYFNFKEDPDNLDISLKKPLDDQILLKPIPFEKDDDQNRHIDFIQAATNCRAGNYKLEQMEWLQVKLKAGRIVPAMATTTACISALQTIETIKVLKKEQNLSSYKNTFLNLAIPYTMQSEPGECEKIKIRQLETNLWTRWNFQLTSQNWTIQSFIQDIEQKYDVKVIGIQQGAKPIYLPLMFTGKEEEEKNQFFQRPIKSLIELQETDEYVEIDVSFEIDGKEVKQPPKIRIYL